MREIKFRVWDVVENEMTLHDSFYEVQRWNRTKDELLQFEILQYTGLKDKNGKEIYEGDVVFVKRYSPGQTRGSFLELTLKDKYRAIVEWDKINPTFVLIEISNRDHVEYDFVCCDLIRLEVIGNIYENPELLEAV